MQMIVAMSDVICSPITEFMFDAPRLRSASAVCSANRASHKFKYDGTYSRRMGMMKICRSQLQKRSATHGQYERHAGEQLDDEVGVRGHRLLHISFVVQVHVREGERDAHAREHRLRHPHGVGSVDEDQQFAAEICWFCANRRLQIRLERHVVVLVRADEQGDRPVLRLRHLRAVGAVIGMRLG